MGWAEREAFPHQLHGSAASLAEPEENHSRRFTIRPSGISGADLVAQAQQAFDRLRPPPASKELPPDPQPAEADPTPQYPTVFGVVSFDQLYAETCRVAGSVMRSQLGMTNPEDIDDCLQVGYLKVWQKLQTQPDWLVDKPKRYIVQAVVLRSKGQRFSHQRYYRKLVYDAEAGQQEGSQLTTAQVETWIDLQQTLTRVAQAIEAQPPLLVAFYNLITQVKRQEVAQTFGYSMATIGKYQRQVRATLAAALVGYGPPPTDKPLLVGQQQVKASARSWVTSQLLEDVPLYARHQEREALQLDVLVEPTPYSPKVVSSRLPEQEVKAEPCFRTGWGGALPLAEILNDPIVRRAAFAKVRQLGLEAWDQEDCVQQGSIKLWQKLQAAPQLLADKGPVWAGIYIAYSGNTRAFHRHYQRRKRFADPDFDWEAADEHFELGLEPRLSPLEVIDQQLDIAGFMQLVAQRYQDDPRKLLALYALTTDVKTRDIAPVLGLHEKNYAAAIGNRVKHEVQQWWQDYFEQPLPEDWQTKLARGEGLEQVAALAGRIENNQRLLLALYVVTTSASRKEVASLFGMGLTAFGQDVGEVKQLLGKPFGIRLLGCE